jgi:hypothetical protein
MNTNKIIKNLFTDSSLKKSCNSSKIIMEIKNLSTDIEKDTITGNIWYVGKDIKIHEVYKNILKRRKDIMIENKKQEIFENNGKFFIFANPEEYIATLKTKKEYERDNKKILKSPTFSEEIISMMN